MFLSALAPSAIVFTGGALSPAAPAAEAASYPYCTNSRSISARSADGKTTFKWRAPATSASKIDCIASTAQVSTYRASTVLIQSAANVLYGQSLKTDGYYGNLTKAAVKVIQQRGGLAGKELDGAYGPITRGFAMYFPVDSPSVWKVRMMYEGGWDLKRR